MRPHPVADDWAGSLFPEPITQAKPILLDDNSKVLALLRNERGELYCNCYGMIVKERKCHKCVGYVSESDTCRWVMSVHDAELVNGKPQWVETKPAPEPPWSGKPVDTFAGAAFRQPAPKLESNQDEGLDFSKEWYYCASGNAIRNHLPCDECIKSEPREGIHCIRLFKLHPCAYFNSAHCNGSTCEYWDPQTIACTYGPYVATLAPALVVEPAAMSKPDLSQEPPFRMPQYSFATGAKFGEKPEHTEAEAHGDDLCSGCLCHTCDWSQHICKSCEDPAACATRGKHTIACPECSGLKKPSRASKKAAKAKKPKCPDISVDCPERGECALNKFWKWRPCALQGVETPAVTPPKESIAVFLNGKWYSDGKLLWDCSDCLCLNCANEGKSCHDCKGFEHCKKIGGTGGKIGACPDFRTEEGKEQHCLENGCLCFKCQLIGTDCEDCPGPIRCDKPRMKCKEYVGAEVEA